MRTLLGFVAFSLAAFIGTTHAANAAYQVLALVASNEVVPLDCRGGCFFSRAAGAITWRRLRLPPTGCGCLPQLAAGRPTSICRSRSSHTILIHA